jgi:aspartate kinase
MIIVNKFGGGILNGAVPIKHLLKIFKSFSPEDSTINVFSAFGKTTNALEKIAKTCQGGEFAESEKLLKDLESFHKAIALELFPEKHAIFLTIENEFKKIKEKFPLSGQAEGLQFIDQILPHGEILATMIIGNYLEHAGIPNKLISAIDFLQTDSSFGSASVDKSATGKNLKAQTRDEIFNPHKNIITEGFVGFSGKWMTTLGREGSDYTAGLLGNLLSAGKVVLWKDVPGVMENNPKISGNKNAKKIDFLTYSQLDGLLQDVARGLVHPKTLKEVKEKGIPLQIRPFWEIDSPGTLID